MYFTQGAILRAHFEAAAGSPTFHDSSAAGHHITCVEATRCPSAVTGSHGQALTFGGDDYLVVPIDVSETDYTAALWFKTADGDAGLLSISAQAKISLCSSAIRPAKTSTIA